MASKCVLSLSEHVPQSLTQNTGAGKNARPRALWQNTIKQLNVWGLNLQATCCLLSLTAELTGQWVQQTRMTLHGACAQSLPRGPFTKVSLCYGQGCGWAGEGKKWLISVLGLCILGPEKNPLIVLRPIFPIFRMATKPPGITTLTN